MQGLPHYMQVLPSSEIFDRDLQTKVEKHYHFLSIPRHTFLPLTLLAFFFWNTSNSRFGNVTYNA